MNFSIHQASHIGNRKYNQDRAAFAYSKEALLLVLADGMGGHLHGEVAAGLAVETFVESFGRHTRIADPLAFLSDTMRCAHLRIMALPQPMDHAFPGTTCVAAMIKDGVLYRGHAGDSRLYLFRHGAVLARTHDHSMVQLWLDWGVISEEDARNHPGRNQIINCLGGAEDLFEIESGKPVSLQSGDVVLLCSDGLYGPFVDKELISAFAASPVAAALDDLIVSALEREDRHADNATGIAMRWGASETAHETTKVVSHILEIN